MSRRVADATLVSLFLLAIAGYGGASLRNAITDSAKLAEGRTLPWKFWPTWAEKYFSEHLAVRDAVVSWHGRIKAEWLRTSPNPEVWLGRDGWLFYNQSAKAGAVSPGDPNFPDRLDHWADALSARRAWLAERGIKYLVVLAPNKQSVYSEYVPRFARRRGPTGLDELLVRCGRDPELNILDLRPALRDARTAGPVYWHTDTHWNAAGTYAGYISTVAALGRWYPAMAPLPPTTFVPRPVQTSGGDLSRMIGLPGRMPDEGISLERLTPARARLVNELADFHSDLLLAHVPPQVWVNDLVGGPRVLLLGDSFANDEYCSLLAEHCGGLVKVGSYAGQQALIERERPDVVVFEFVERTLEHVTLRGPR
jgi:alginate O-acetyltransferase complex protein AlgJ